MDIKRLVYDHSPIWWQNFMCTMAGYTRVRQRYDKLFNKRREFFRKASKWSLAEAESFQLEKLQHLARYAYEKVPFYKRLFDQAKVKPKDIRKLSDWEKIPISSKDDFRRAGKELIASGYNPRKLHSSCTSGSTGMPLTCYHDCEALRNVYASGWEYFRPGVKLYDRYATFSGMQLIPPRQVGGPYWRMNKAMKQRLYSIFHLSKQTIKDYIGDLDAYEPVYLEGYAHSLYLLAKLTEEAGITPKCFPKAVFATSEQLLDSHCHTIERVFHTKVWNAYSQDEMCGSISEYECGYCHYDRAYGYMEFEDIETRGDRRLAEIICTGFLNNAWPILRYRIDDIAEYEPVEACPRCGRAGPIIHEIRGRISDALITPSGRYFPYINRIIKPLRGLREIQLVQESIDKVVIRYVPSEDFRPDKDKALILRTFQQSIGEPIHWLIEKVDEIPRTRAGKFKMIINRIGENPP
ncbi:MAG: hypothetical protein WBC22_14970 [Sedimentisphaerales bacterium]